MMSCIDDRDLVVLLLSAGVGSFGLDAAVLA